MWNCASLAQWELVKVKSSFLTGACFHEKVWAVKGRRGRRNRQGQQSAGPQPSNRNARVNCKLQISSTRSNNAEVVISRIIGGTAAMSIACVGANPTGLPEPIASTAGLFGTVQRPRHCVQIQRFVIHL